MNQETEPLPVSAGSIIEACELVERVLPRLPTTAMAAITIGVMTIGGARPVAAGELYQPPPPACKHTVGKGDTLYSLAQRSQTTVDAIAEANNLADPDRIIVGQILNIPCLPEAEMTPTLPSTATPLPSATPVPIEKPSVPDQEYDLAAIFAQKPPGEPMIFDFSPRSQQPVTLIVYFWKHEANIQPTDSLGNPVGLAADFTDKGLSSLSHIYQIPTIHLKVVRGDTGGRLSFEKADPDPLVAIRLPIEKTGDELFPGQAILQELAGPLGILDRTRSAIGVVSDQAREILERKGREQRVNRLSPTPPPAGSEDSFPQFYYQARLSQLLPADHPFRIRVSQAIKAARIEGGRVEDLFSLKDEQGKTVWYALVYYPKDNHRQLKALVDLLPALTTVPETRDNLGVTSVVGGMLVLTALTLWSVVKLAKWQERTFG